MLIDIIRIGNSKGIRIPKVILEECGLAGQAEMTVENGRLILQAPSRPRQGWEAAAQEMVKNGDDALLWPEHPLTSFDDEEWEW